MFNSSLRAVRRYTLPINTALYACWLSGPPTTDNRKETPEKLLCLAPSPPLFASLPYFAPLLCSLTLLLPPSPSSLLSWRRRNVIAVDRVLPRNSYYASKNNYQPSTPTRPPPPEYSNSRHDFVVARIRRKANTGSRVLGQLVPRPSLANNGSRYDWPARVQSVDGEGEVVESREVEKLTLGSKK